MSPLSKDETRRDGSNPFIVILSGLSMGMGFPWESYGKCPVEWDGTARIAFAMNDNKCQNVKKL